LKGNGEMRKSYNSKFKAKVALEAIKGEFSITELISYTRFMGIEK